MFDDCIIMAGGFGTRLWPASTSARPKQFISIPSGGKENSFFRSAIERALAVTADSDGGQVIIIAGKDHKNLIVEECAGLDLQDRKRLVLIPEPLAKNTAPAIACALLYIDWVAAGRERNVLVLTSDNIINPTATFRTDANAAAAMAQADKLVVFGIPPLGPETEYGYIEAAETLTVPPDENTGHYNRYEPEVFAVASFYEKPDVEKVKNFIATKNHYWNLGMYAFSSKFMLSEYRRLSPEVIAPFRELWAPNELSYQTQKGLRILEEWENMETAYQKTKQISFTYAIAEKCRAVVMVKAGFSWTNVGSWDEYARLSKQSAANVYGSKESTDSCFVDSDIPVALCAVEDLIVVVRSGKDGGEAGVLISKKGQTQRVREIVEKMKAEKY